MVVEAMAKRILDRDEWRPFYELDEPRPHTLSRARDFPDDLIERHDRIMAEFKALQDELAALYE